MNYIKKTLGFKDNYRRMNLWLDKEPDIPQFVDDLLKLDPIEVGRNAQGPYAKYIIDEQTYTLAYGDNGYIVNLYPSK